MKIEDSSTLCIFAGPYQLTVPTVPSNTSTSKLRIKLRWKIKMASQDETVQEAKKTAISYATEWGKSPLPPTLLATLITALHARPLQKLPMAFTPVLLFSTYLNLNSFTVDSAGLTAAWSGLYLLLARRRKAPGSSVGARFGSRFGARGLVRGWAMALAATNVVSCGATYALGRRSTEERVV
ncbi:hypothetical protein PVAG01_01210 [Phlyctema vagabunda]|uniref:Uncharacterized protein n=1 Tax=Phlyctema vagabunda TaxID=108571 RepID=A0ABR4PXX8_9HELO